MPLWLLVPVGCATFPLLLFCDSFPKLHMLPVRREYVPVEPKHVPVQHEYVPVDPEHVPVQREHAQPQICERSGSLPLHLLQLYVDDSVPGQVVSRSHASGLAVVFGSARDDVHGVESFLEIHLGDGPRSRALAGFVVDERPLLAVVEGAVREARLMVVVQGSRFAVDGQEVWPQPQIALDASLGV